ncbi:hypothetical protein RUND412_000922 [Rhizina undulata]
MGQGASTPQNDGRESTNTGSSGPPTQQQNVRTTGTANVQTPHSRENTPLIPIANDLTTANLRRSRRLRSHIDHLARLGNRLMPSSSSSSSSTSSRMQSIRFRSRGLHLSASRSPSPSARGGPTRSGAVSPRRTRTLSSISHQLPLHSTNYADDTADMMDISPVTSAVSPPPSPPPAPIEYTTRRTRMSRVRSSLSISSWPNLLHEMGSSRPGRPSSRRPSQSDQPGTFESMLDPQTRNADMDIDPPSASAPDIPSSTPLDTPPLRHERSSINGAASLLDELDNPARVRPGEDQAAMLSRLLSVAAAATAASLVGNSEQAITEAQDVAGDNGGDGSFESFLRALQNGRLAAALRNGGNELGGGAPSDGTQSDSAMPPLNFFRMFRFGSTPSTNAGESSNAGEGSNTGENQPSRMVPVIIVGIRSVTPRDAADAEGNRPTPFFDALANLPVSLPMRRSRLSNNNRRASMSGVPGSSYGLDSLRHQRSSSTQSRPQSEISRYPPPVSSPVQSETPPGPLPPPSTPAEHGMSGYSNGSHVANSNDNNELPLPASLNENVASPSTLRESSARRRVSRRLSSPDPIPPFSSPPRRSSGSSMHSSGGAGLGGGSSSRRPTGNSPTYEDMTLLSSLLGPAKPPVATREDVNSAGGIFTVGSENVPANVTFSEGDRCLVCLSDYEAGEECRQLTKCLHVFHRDCIDEWLTTGRNSCPLCRGQGVNEKEHSSEQNQPTPPVDPFLQNPS